MATNHTQNYQLNLWEPGDSFLRVEFNENSQKIDAALGTKADKSALTALTQTMAGKGNCQIVTGSYVGTGEYGSDHPNSITLPGKPLLLFIGSYSCVWAVNGQTHAIVHYSTNERLELYLQWTENTVTWHGGNNNARSQMNEQNYTYYYAALIAQ